MAWAWYIHKSLKLMDETPVDNFTPQLVCAEDRVLLGARPRKWNEFPQELRANQATCSRHKGHVLGLAFSNINMCAGDCKGTVLPSAA